MRQWKTKNWHEVNFDEGDRVEFLDIHNGEFAQCINVKRETKAQYMMVGDILQRVYDSINIQIYLLT